MSNFEFLTTEWKDVHAADCKAESTAIPDPRTSCFYARRALELALELAVQILQNTETALPRHSITECFGANFDFNRSQNHTKCFRNPNFTLILRSNSKTLQ